MSLMNRNKEGKTGHTLQNQILWSTGETGYFKCREWRNWRRNILYSEKYNIECELISASWLVRRKSGPRDVKLGRKYSSARSSKTSLVAIRWGLCYDTSGRLRAVGLSRLAMLVRRRWMYTAWRRVERHLIVVHHVNTFNDAMEWLPSRAFIMEEGHYELNFSILRPCRALCPECWPDLQKEF